jgi:hypothetical protein
MWCNIATMEKNSIRITLRIPEQLHEKLANSADLGTRSLNSEIVKRLEESFLSNTDDRPLTASQVRELIKEELAKAGKG